MEIKKHNKINIVKKYDPLKTMYKNNGNSTIELKILLINSLLIKYFQIFFSPFDIFL